MLDETDNTTLNSDENSTAEILLDAVGPHRVLPGLLPKARPRAPR